MGNSQNLMGVCAPRETPDGVVPDATPVQPVTEEELNEFMSKVKANVISQIEPFEDRFQRYYKALEPHAEVLTEATKAFTEEMQIGLVKHKNGGQGPHCSMKMLDSYVVAAPTGDESGVFYALDFGGSNFRILRVSMENGEITVDAKKASLFDYESDLPKGLLDPKATATMLFDFFASVVREFLVENGDMESGQTYPLGFTFSYPCKSKSLAEADHLQWNKGFETGRDSDDPVEGCDVGALMKMALKRHNVPLELNCVANDTVGTLLAAGYTMPKSLPPCMIGMILGTGVNACYVEPRAKEYGYTGSIINMESGAFDRALPTTNLDYELDFADVAGRGKQHFEKMTSGGYLGEICRRAFVKILQHKASSKMFEPGSFTSEDASACIGDLSESLVVVERKCREKLEAELTPQELRWIREICAVVFRRSAALSAVKIAGTALMTGRLQSALGGLTCAIDGSLWKCNPFFRDDIRMYLEQILGKHQADLIHLISADDGSGVGAAVLAAVAAKN